MRIMLATGRNAIVNENPSGVRRLTVDFPTLVWWSDEKRSMRVQNILGATQWRQMTMNETSARIT